MPNEIKNLQKTEISFLNPYSAVDEFGVGEGMSVADFGSGAGHFVLSLANRVGRDGRVYAIDMRQSVLEVLEGYIKLKGLVQIKTIKGNVEQVNGSVLHEGSQDVVLCSNILHQVDHPFNVLKEAHRVLKGSGRLVVIDWIKNAKLGPANRISPKKIEELAGEAGFKKEKEFQTGDQHYGLIFKKKL